MRHGYFLNSTCDMVENKRQRHETLSFLKIDVRHRGPSSAPDKLHFSDGQPASQLAGGMQGANPPGVECHRDLMCSILLWWAITARFLGVGGLDKLWGCTHRLAPCSQ